MFRWRWVLVSSVFAFTIGLLLAGRGTRAQLGNARQLTFPPAGSSDIQPAFSPRGDRVAFARISQVQGALTDLYVADVASGQVSILVKDLPAEWAPNGGLEWSPDGSHLAFVAGGQTGEVIWLVDVPSGRGKP